MVGCSGAIDVASELKFVAFSIAVKDDAGEAVRVGWLTERCGCLASWSSVFLSGVPGFERTCGFVGEPFELKSDLLLEWPSLSDICDLGLNLAFSFSSCALFVSSSKIVSTSARFPPVSFRRPVFWSTCVKGGLGGAFLGGAVFGVDDLVFDPLISVPFGVKMLSVGLTGSRVPTASLLCAFEKVG